MSQVPNQGSILVGASGAIAPVGAQTIFHVTKAGVCAMTLAAPSEDGQRVIVIDDSGHAHTLVCTGAGSPPTAGLNGGTTDNELTWNGTIGSAVELYSNNGFWYTGPLAGVTVS